MTIGIGLALRRQATFIVEAVRMCGSDTTEIRDAAHEAHHALFAGVPVGLWQRETIHARLCLGAQRSDLIAYELDARAVEKLVCETLDVEYDDEHWLMMMCIETIKTVGVCPPDKDLRAGIASRLRSPAIHEAVRAVLSLGAMGGVS